MHQQLKAIEAQAQKVRTAYAKCGRVNPDYEREFDILSDMRADYESEMYRKQRGLPSCAVTPYDRKPSPCNS